MDARNEVLIIMIIGILAVQGAFIEVLDIQLNSFVKGMI